MRSIDHHIDHIKDSIMFKKLVIASALALAASASFAQTAPGVYAGVDIGSVDIDGLDDKDTAAGVFAGYNFNETFSVEAGYRQAKFDGFKLQQLSLSAIGTIPMGNNFSLYGRLGYNDIDSKVRANGGTFTGDIDSGALYGVGLGYAFTPTVTGRVEYQRPTSDASIITAGVSFKF
jgi:OOP family OmpA-OmpF porin